VSGKEARLARLVEPILPGLEQMRVAMIAQLSEDSGAVRDMTDHIARFHGKQLRGSLLMLVAKAHGVYTEEHPTVAAIVELIHLATLVHDDVLDGAEVRRRVACVNERWDNQIAVLLGDFLYARAFGLSTELSSRLCSRLLSDTTRRLCVGEIEQSTLRYDFELDQKHYERIAAAKTGTLYAAACELGVRYPGGDVESGTAMRAFGEEIGLAFQIIDDCLDVVGDQEVVGKSVGNDVDDGKVTLPVLRTYALADEPTRARIRDAYTLPEIEDRRGALREVCDLGPGTDYALARADELVGRALGRLRDLPASPAREALEGIGEFVLERRW
jgi:octaprenyl-diphosphate synthase